MNKHIAFFVLAASLVPTQANAVINQCHKSACPPIKRSVDSVKQSPDIKKSPTINPSKRKG
jgi:hypothetical protein